MADGDVVPTLTQRDNERMEKQEMFRHADVFRFYLFVLFFTGYYSNDENPDEAYHAVSLQHQIEQQVKNNNNNACDIMALQEIVFTKVSGCVEL